MSLLYYAVLAALVGLSVGSFLNVVAYRLPRGESLVHPPSHCPGCDGQIRAYDNVPVLAWVLLRGRCRDCRAPISVRYPIVEAVTGALAVAVVLVHHRTGHDLALGLALVAVLIPVVLIDFDHQIIPNRITAPSALAAVLLGALTRPSGLPEQLIAGAGAGGFLLFFVLAYPRGMGMGDAKLAGVLGLFLGREVGVAIMVALAAGTLAGLVVMARLGVERGRRTRVPFGPFLALGGLVGLLYGAQIIDWYLGIIS